MLDGERQAMTRATAHYIIPVVLINASRHDIFPPPIQVVERRRHLTNLDIDTEISKSTPVIPSHSLSLRWTRQTLGNPSGILGKTSSAGVPCSLVFTMMLRSPGTPADRLPLVSGPLLVPGKQNKSRPFPWIFTSRVSAL
jgi:hypothetical protein